MNRQCHFCGEELNEEGNDSKGERHWLSDCRPDLVKHEPGVTCTWPNEDFPLNCYAYQDVSTLKWTTEHKHFYEDGPM